MLCENNEIYYENSHKILQENVKSPITAHNFHMNKGHRQNVHALNRSITFRP